MFKGHHLAHAVLVAMLGVAAFLCGVGGLELFTHREVTTWLGERPLLYVSRLDEEERAALLVAVQDFADSEGATVVGYREQTEATGLRVYTFASYAPTGAVPFAPLEILATPVLDPALVREVSQGPRGAYAGLGADESLQVTRLPGVRGCVAFQVSQLTTGQCPDTLTLLGVDKESFERLVPRLATAAGVSSETLRTRMSGGALIPGLRYLVSAGVFCALALVCGLLTVADAFLCLRDLGCLLLLGWSRVRFLGRFTARRCIALAALVPVAVLGTALALEGFPLTSAVLVFAVVAVAPAAVVVLLGLLAASAVLLSTRPLDATSSRYSRKGLLVPCYVLYAACLAGAFGACLYLDQPVQLYGQLSQTETVWSEYGSWLILRDFESDGSHYSGDVMALAPELYAWYRQHEHDAGVYLARSMAFEEPTIRAYGLSAGAPEPFWCLACSPSYLQRCGVKLGEQTLMAAESGTRLYLFPNTWGRDRVLATSELLERVFRPVESPIETEFMKDPRVECLRYQGRPLFAWDADLSHPAYRDDFVLCVVTAANMVPFESESLAAGGLQNGYIKLAPDGAASLGAGLKAPLGGGVNAVFASVTDFIGGAQRSLREVLWVFGAILALLAVATAGTLACLIKVTDQIRRREVVVKRLLGFGVFQIYGTVAVLAMGSVVVITVVCVALGSRVALAMGTVLLLVTAATFAVTGRRGVESLAADCGEL